MLACNACIRKTIRLFLADVVDTTTPILNRPQCHRLTAGRTKPPQSWTRRTLASAAQTTASAPAREGSTEMDLMPLYTKQKQRAMIARLAFDEGSLREELKYLRDPLKLAEYIDDLLRKDAFEKAAELVRMASKSIPCTVSWNHLVNYEMSQGRVNSAVKLYNEMKKRAQVPDSRTFTILFRGFASHPQYPNSLDRALSIYQSMSADNCAVKPSIIHTNAVLNVGARFMNVDAMLAVAAKLPTRGAKAPNKVTFTTIINAIRTTTLKMGQTLSDDEKWESRQTAMSQGRSIWGEVRDRWQNRDIEVDEEMVCAMGRLLLLGSTDRDCHDVLSLVEQTMGIPRQAPRLKNGNDGAISDRPSRHGQASKSTSEPQQPESDGWTGEGSEESLALQSPSGMAGSDDEENVLGNEFDPVDPRKIKYVQPGHNALSMVMDACISLKAFRAAQDYWGLLSDPSGKYNITPDAENYHVYLRLLRMKRASKISLEMLEELSYNPPGGIKVLQPKTFRIAMSTCLRDVNNPNALTHANKMARIMLDSQERTDARALSMYLSLALTIRHLQWKSLMEVLRGCEIGVRNLRSFLSYGDRSNTKGGKEDHEEEAIQFVTKLARAFQTAMSLGKGQMNFEEERFCQVQGHRMSDWALRMKKMDRGRGQWEEKRGSNEGRGGEEEENDWGRNSDELTKSNGSTEVVDAVDRGKQDPNGRSPWKMLRNNPRSARVDKTDDVSTEVVDAVDRGKQDLNGRTPWKMLRNNQRSAKADKIDDVSTENPTSSSEAKNKRFLGSNYRPSFMHNYRKTLDPRTRMRARSAKSWQQLRGKIDEDEDW